MANLTTATATTLIRLLLDKASAPFYTDAEIALFLELGIKEFINENYKKFELNQSTRDNLRALVKTDTSLTVANGNTFSLPTDYRHFLSFEVRTPVGKQFVKLMRINDFLAIKNDPFNKPSDKNVVGVLEDDKIKLYGDSNFFEDYTLTYLKWDESSDDIETLSENTHEDIVNITVRKLMAGIKDEGYNLQVGEELKNKI